MRKNDTPSSFPSPSPGLSVSLVRVTACGDPLEAGEEGVGERSEGVWRLQAFSDLRAR